MPEYKTDQQSINAALEHLIEKCKRINNFDEEAIADAIYVSAVKFDVDESVLNNAWGDLAPQTFLNSVSAGVHLHPKGHLIIDEQFGRDIQIKQST